MVIISSNARSQITALTVQFCGHKTKGEVGRSAFWIWYDKIQNEVRNIDVKKSKKVGASSYVYHMEYWGDIKFNVLYIRNKGRFAGYNILISGFDFDNANFHNWLQHKALTSTSAASTKKPKTFRKISKNIGMGYLKVRTKSGQWMIADANGKPVSGDLFKDVSYMRKTGKGEIAALVNIGGTGYAFYPKRENGRKLETTNKSWRELFSESRNGAMTITESDLRMMVRECINRLLNESEYYKYGEKERAYVESFGLESRDFAKYQYEEIFKGSSDRMFKYYDYAWKKFMKLSDQHPEGLSFESPHFI